ncbi:hypothetical protein BOX15_Mlig006672g1, partial [Macrostomum lignano]
RLEMPRQKSWCNRIVSKSKRSSLKTSSLYPASEHCSGEDNSCLQAMPKQEGKSYQPASASAGESAASGDSLDFLIRPRFGNKFSMMKQNGEDQQRESVLLSSVLNQLENPEAQADALAQLGIRLLSKSRVQLDLQEYPPSKLKKQKNGSKSTSAHKQPSQPSDSSIELHGNFITRNPVIQPLGIRVNYLRDAYIEAETVYCCLLEVSSPYGDAFAVPVLGRGSFNLLGDEEGKWPHPTMAQREHCISGVSAGFLQRAAVSLTCLLCLCELSPQDEASVIDFYRKVDKTYNYGYGPYINYLVYCCQTESRIRDSYLKYLCLEFNNRFTQDLMTQALKQFVETRQPTKEYYEQVPTMLTSEELAKDREVHYSVKGRAAKASMYLKNASRQHLACCPCHVM